MVEVDIHCNVIKCRRPLSIEQQACVTSCSHIFCLDCTKKHFSNALVCPACNTTLTEERDDIILIQLNPTEEYKSSVLAGLKPDIILDICSRAIAFYEYQSCQELNFRSLLQKSTEEKYNSLKGQFDIVTRDLNHIIKVEKEKQKVALSELDLEKKKSMQLYSKYEDKSKQFQKLQVMYEKLKRKSIVPNIQESFMGPPPSGTTQHQPMTSMQPPPPPNSATRTMMRLNQPPPPVQQSFVVDKDEDIISRLGRSSSVARSVFMSAPPQQQQYQMIVPPLSAPHPQQQYHSMGGQEIERHNYTNTMAPPPVVTKSSPTTPQKRMPSPVKSIYSVRSHHRKFYSVSSVAIAGTGGTRSAPIIQQQQQQQATTSATRKKSHHHHHRHSRHSNKDNHQQQPPSEL